LIRVQNQIIQSFGSRHPYEALADVPVARAFSSNHVRRAGLAFSQAM